MERMLAEDTSTDPGVASELDELAMLGVLTRAELSPHRRAEDAVSYGDCGVAGARLTGLGRLVYELLSLKHVPHEDILDTIADRGDYRSRRR
jgi:hypothetical protein